METLYIGIVGSRRRNTLRDMRQVGELERQLVEENPDKRIVVVSGGCKVGADNHAEFYAKMFKLELDLHPVDDRDIKGKWDYAQRAFARNRIVADRSTGGVYCWVHSSRTGGTENTISHAIELGRPVFLVDDDGKVYRSSDGKMFDGEAVKHL